MLTIYRRHQHPCGYRSRRYRKCTCPIWVQGSLRGEYVRRSLDMRAWEAATDLIREWESAGTIGAKRQRAPTIAEAVGDYLADAKGRAWRESSLAKYRRLLEGEFVAFCRERNVASLDRVTVPFIREFRAEKLIGHAPITQAKKLEYLRSFMRFCVDADWIAKNHAKAVQLPTVRQKPTLPFTDEEIERLFQAVDTFKGNAGRVRALFLLLLFSGLRIGDAIALQRTRIKKARLFLYTAKTGTPVYVPLPKHVIEALDALPGDRYFWSGKGGIKVAIESYRRRLLDLAERAEVENAHFHRFRDSFAVSLLRKGVGIETVSMLLGHSSIRVTERHYKPHVQELQDLLERAVREAWTEEPTEPATV